MTAACIDRWVSGGYRFRMQKGAQVIEMCGEHREIAVPSRLVFTWRQEGEPQMDVGETLVKVDFIDVREGTEVHIMHAGFSDDEQRQEPAEGWAQCFNEMARLLSDNRTKQISGLQRLAPDDE